MSRLTALVGRVQREGFHHGHGRSFFGKIKPVEIFDCKTKGIGSETAMFSQLA
jgi:hypothetical protein